MSVTVLHEKCELDAAKDTTLPNTAYLVEYTLEGKQHMILLSPQRQ